MLSPTTPSPWRLSPPLSTAGREFRLCTIAERDDYFDDLTAASLPAAVRIAELILPRDATIIDVGANLGFCAIPFAHISPSGYILAVEPGRRAAACLRAAIELNGIVNIEVAEQAVGAESGGAVLIDPTWNASGAFISRSGSSASGVHEARGDVDAHTVEITTLDDLVESKGLNRLDFMKIDVEGFESNVLAGAVGTIERFIPWTVIEFNPFTLSVMASENPLHFLVKLQTIFPYLYGIDGDFNVEHIVGATGAYGVVSRCFSAGGSCDLLGSFTPFPDIMGRRRLMFSGGST